MEHEHRNCPRCGKPAGDFHFCPSCLAPVDSLSALSTLRAQPSLAAAEGDRTVGHDSTAVLEVEEERAAEADTGSAPASQLQVHLDGHASVTPPAAREVARLEDVLTIGSKPTQPRVSVPPPAPREVARLEDVLTVRPTEDAAQIPPKTAAAATQVETVTEVAPAEEVKPCSAPGPKAAARTYVPAYALRAAFWFEQASAFEAASDDDEDDEIEVVAAAPEAEMVQAPADVAASQIVTDEVQAQTPRKNWILALFAMTLAGLAIALIGRRPCRCNCKGTH
jgi:hypothetical protein